MYSFRLIDLKISKIALNMSTLSFAVKRNPKYTQPLQEKRKRERGSKIESWITKGSVRELNNTAKTKSNLNKKGIRKCHHPKHGAVS